jgi:hypothetical protein
MGTRHLTKVIDSTGRTRVAQYGQWDGYPSYTGTRILDFITEHGNLDRIEKALRKVHFITDEELSSFIQVDTDVNTVYPQFSRDTGCDILKVIAYSTGYTLPLFDESEFEHDGLFCEGVYTVDYQTNKFISKFDEAVVEFPLNALPDEVTYLQAFINARANIEEPIDNADVLV